MKQLDLEGYGQRCEALLALLAEATGQDPGGERERFRFCIERFRRADLGADPGNAGPLALAKLFGIDMPMVFEFTLVAEGERPTGFGYATQLQRGGTLSQNVSGALVAALGIHLESGGELSQGELLADAFRLAFADLEALNRYAPLSPAIQVRVWPLLATLAVELAVNTQLGAIADHAACVSAVLTRAGISQADALGAVLTAAPELRFEFLSLRPHEGRACISGWLPRERALESVVRLGKEMGVDVAPLATESRVAHETLEGFVYPEARLGVVFGPEPAVEVSWLLSNTDTWREQLAAVQRYYEGLGVGRLGELSLEAAQRCRGERQDGAVLNSTLRTLTLELRRSGIRRSVAFLPLV